MTIDPQDAATYPVGALLWCRRRLEYYRVVEVDDNGTGRLDGICWWLADPWTPGDTGWPAHLPTLIGDQMEVVSWS